MWVKIKSKKIPNTILNVPYQAYVSIYSLKGFVLVDDKNAKNSTDIVVNAGDKITLDEEELNALKQIKGEEEKPQPVVEEKLEPKFEIPIPNSIKQKQEIVADTSSVSKYATGRAPIKKATSTKR